MPPLPTTISIIICDHTIVDRETHKRSLIGIFQNIRSPQFPCQHQLLHVYASVTDAQGEYVFSIRLVEVNTDNELWKMSLPPLEIKDRMHVQEICLRILRITFPSPGKYEFQLFANDQLLALRRVNLELISPGQPPGSPDEPEQDG